MGFESALLPGPDLAAVAPAFGVRLGRFSLSLGCLPDPRSNFVMPKCPTDRGRIVLFVLP